MGNFYVSRKQDIALSVLFPDWIAALFNNNPMLLAHTFDKDTVLDCYGLKFNRDPFDRAIVASALQLGLPLITNDRLIHEKQPCHIYWD